MKAEREEHYALGFQQGYYEAFLEMGLSEEEARHRAEMAVTDADVYDEEKRRKTEEQKRYESGLQDGMREKGHYAKDWAFEAIWKWGSQRRKPDAKRPKNALERQPDGEHGEQNNSNLTDTGNRTPGPAARYQLNPDGCQRVYRKYWNIPILCTLWKRNSLLKIFFQHIVVTYYDSKNDLLHVFNGNAAVIFNPSQPGSADAAAKTAVDQSGFIVAAYSGL